MLRTVYVHGGGWIEFRDMLDGHCVTRMASAPWEKDGIHSQHNDGGQRNCLFSSQVGGRVVADGPRRNPTTAPLPPTNVREMGRCCDET